MNGPINSITNANLYIGTENFFGKIKELALPEGAIKTVEYAALGMLGTIDLPSGFEKLEGKITWASFYADALKKTGKAFEMNTYQARASIKQYSSGGGLIGEVPLVATLRGTAKNLPMGNFKQNEAVEAETNLTFSYIKLTMNGEDIYEVDVVNNIYKVGGVDQLTAYRNNIGQ